MKDVLELLVALWPIVVILALAIVTLVITRDKKEKKI